MWQGYISTLEAFNINFQCHLTFPIALQGCSASSHKMRVSAGLGSVVSQRSLFSYVQMLFRQKSKCQTRGGGKKLVNQMIHDMWNIRHQQEKTFGFFFFFSHCVYACVFSCEKCNKSWSVLTKRRVVLRCPGGLYHAQCWHQSIDAWQVMSHFPCPERRSHLYGDDYR